LKVNKKPKLALKILSLEGVAYLEKEVDQWVCYAKEGYWFPELECQTCIDTNLATVWAYTKGAVPTPESYRP
jgi:hypothetical protein